MSLAWNGAAVTVGWPLILVLTRSGLRSSVVLPVQVLAAAVVNSNNVPSSDAG